MYTTRNHPIKKAIMAQVKFLHWVEVPLAELGIDDIGIERCWISPDVHSLHLLWEEADGDQWHEIADYNINDEAGEVCSPADFLSMEIGDDSYGDVEGDPFEIMSDYGGHYDADNQPPMLDMALLQRYFENVAALAEWNR